MARYNKQPLTAVPFSSQKDALKIEYLKNIFFHSKLST